MQSVPACLGTTVKGGDTTSKVMYDQVCFYMLRISAESSAPGGQEYSWPTSPSDLLTFWVYEILKKSSWRAPKKKGDTLSTGGSQISALNNTLQHFIADEMYNVYHYSYCQ